MERNWKNIAEIGNRLLRLTLSTIRLSTDEGEKLIEAFPFCFGEVGKGPIPLSILLTIEKELKVNERESWTLGKFLVAHGVFNELSIPLQEYGFDEESAEVWKIPVLPADINRQTPVGQIVIIDGAEVVVVENNDNDCVNTMSVAPATAILIDCKVEVTNP